MSESGQPTGVAPEEDAAPGSAEESETQANPLEAEVATLRADLARTQDRYRRALADLDNYRKRTAQDGERRAAAARTAVVRDWLDAIDAVDRALLLTPEDAGLLAVRGQMEGILRRQGVARMEPVGGPFDPSRHEAIDVRVVPDQPDYIVLDVARAGFDDTDGGVLRPAQVVVSKRPAGGSEG